MNGGSNAGFVKGCVRFLRPLHPLTPVPPTTQQHLPVAKLQTRRILNFIPHLPDPSLRPQTLLNCPNADPDHSQSRCCGHKQQQARRRVSGHSNNSTNKSEAPSAWHLLSCGVCPPDQCERPARRAVPPTNMYMQPLVQSTEATSAQSLTFTSSCRNRCAIVVWVLPPAGLLAVCWRTRAGGLR